MPVNDLQKKGGTLCPNSLMLNDLRKCRTFPVPTFPRPPLAHKKHFLTAYTLKDSCRVFFGWTSYVHVSWYNVLMTKTKRIEVRQWSKHVNVAIFDLVKGGFPRVRSSSSQSHLNRILREENANARHVELIHMKKV